MAWRHLNFRTAADDLGVTQGVVAQQVRLLEAHLDIALFERLPRGLAFTTPGRAYHARVAAAFSDLRAATDILRPEAERVLISVTPTFAAKWLIPSLPDFSAAHPNIDLQILATEKVSRFHGDGIDLAVRQGQPPFGASLDSARLFRQEIIAVVAPRLLAGRAVPLSPEYLAKLPQLHDAHDLWPAFIRQLGISDPGGHGLRLSQTALALDVALSAQGVALVSRFLVARELAAGHLLQVAPQVLMGKQDFYLLAGRHPRRGAAADAVWHWFITRASSEV